MPSAHLGVGNPLSGEGGHEVKSMGRRAAPSLVPYVPRDDCPAIPRPAPFP